MMTSHHFLKIFMSDFPSGLTMDLINSFNIILPIVLACLFLNISYNSNSMLKATKMGLGRENVLKMVIMVIPNSF
jgi:hypothetical protein